MANIENNPEKNEKQVSEFAKNQELKSKVYDAIEQQLKDSTEKAFKSEGIENRNVEKNSQQGWNKGVYSDGSTYGTGAAKGQLNVKINRAKGSKSTNGFFEKIISFGGKRMVIEIHVDLDVDSKKIDITYKTTEDSFFRGHQDKKGPFMIDDSCSMKVDEMNSFKSDLKKKLDGYAVREANYMIKTKMGIEDRVEKDINSMVENNMKKLSLKDILSADFDEAISKIMESTKKKEKKGSEKLNHPEIKDANSPGNLLFDDLDEAEKKHGKNYRDYFEKKMKKFGASNPNELKPSEWKTINNDWKSEKENNLDEVTSSAGGAGAGAFLTPGAFKKGGDFDKEMKKPNKPTNKVKESVEDKFSQTPYAQRDKKRSLKRENVNGWTTVELDSDGYAPKGMDKSHPLGLHGVEVNSAEEDRLSKGSPKGRAAMKKKESEGLSEGLDLNKKKFFITTENEEKGVNKRYIITHKRSSDEEKNRWASLSNFEKNSTVRLAESCGCPVDDGTREKMVSREQGEEENKTEFMKRNQSVNAGDEVNGRVVVAVSKPGSLSGAEFKVFEDEYLNESKAFILDLNTGNLVNNPNYKTKEMKEYTIQEEVSPINESVQSRPTKNVPNTAYYFDSELGRLVRNPNFKVN